MSDALPLPELVDENDSVITGRHPVRPTLPILAAPTDSTRAAAFNTTRSPLVTVACTSLKDSNFKFDSSFIGPEVKEKRGFVNFASMVRAYPDSPIAIFGHADPTGDPAYNQVLSGRRAKAVFAVLVRDVQMWEDLYDPGKRGLAVGDEWGIRSVQVMLRALGIRPEPAAEDGDQDAVTRAEIRTFQTTPIVLPDGGDLPLLPPTGANDRATRRRLFTAYMNHICQDQNGKDFRLGVDAFLRGGKSPGAFQGCSEFNPRRLPSAERIKDWKKGGPAGKEDRDAFHRENRRVVIYLFRKGTTFDPKQWPCPAAVGDPSACVRRFWSTGGPPGTAAFHPRKDGAFQDHSRRFGRSVPPAARTPAPPVNPTLGDELGREETTFACRFYHGLAIHSPCERDLKMWIIRLLVDDVTVDVPGQPAKSVAKVPVANRRFVARMGKTPDAPVIRGRTSDQGRLGLPLFEDPAGIELKVDVFGDPAKEPKDPADVDTQAFADEGGFTPIGLSGGPFPRIREKQEGDFDFDPEFDATGDLTPAERDRGRFQRLYNLGYGSGDHGPDFEKWTPEQRKLIIERFQRDHPPLEASGTFDAETDKVLFTEYGG